MHAYIQLTHYIAITWNISRIPRFFLSSGSDIEYRAQSEYRVTSTALCVTLCAPPFHTLPFFVYSQVYQQIDYICVDLDRSLQTHSHTHAKCTYTPTIINLASNWELQQHFWYIIKICIYVCAHKTRRNWTICVNKENNMCVEDAISAFKELLTTTTGSTTTTDDHDARSDAGKQQTTTQRHLALFSQQEPRVSTTAIAHNSSIPIATQTDCCSRVYSL